MIDCRNAGAATTVSALPPSRIHPVFDADDRRVASQPLESERDHQNDEYEGQQDSEKPTLARRICWGRWRQRGHDDTSDSAIKKELIRNSSGRRQPHPVRGVTNPDGIRVFKSACGGRDVDAAARHSAASRYRNDLTAPPAVAASSQITAIESTGSRSEMRVRRLCSLCRGLLDSSNPSRRTDLDRLVQKHTAPVFEAEQVPEPIAVVPLAAHVFVDQPLDRFPSKDAA